jgi:hypothetical protein
MPRWVDIEVERHGGGETGRWKDKKTPSLFLNSLTQDDIRFPSLLIGHEITLPSLGMSVKPSIW